MKTLIAESETDIKVWPGYTDVALTLILILLLALFIQIIISSQTTAATLEMMERQGEIQTAVDSVLQTSLNKEFTISSDGSLQRFQFANEVLFDAGQATLKESGKRVLGTLGRVLLEKVGSFSRIQIEGHTDDNPIHTAQFPSNWELSSARATSVVRYLQDHVGLEPALLSATGYSEYQPVAPNDDKHRSSNRRIELVLVYSILSDNKQEEPDGQDEPSGDTLLVKVEHAVPGYCVQVYSAQDQARARRVTEEAQSWWRTQQQSLSTGLDSGTPTTLTTHILYRGGHYSVHIGGFLSEEGARLQLEMFRGQYPDAVVTRDNTTQATS